MPVSVFAKMIDRQALDIMKTLVISIEKSDRFAISPYSFFMTCKVMTLCDSYSLHARKTMTENHCTIHSISSVYTFSLQQPKEVLSHTDEEKNLTFKFLLLKNQINN